jgi:ABC-2 type transport system permease protein
MHGTVLPMWAIVERDLRKYFRSPTLLLSSLVLPLLQLVVLGYAFGGQIKGVAVALVALDRGPQAVRLRERFSAVEAGAQTFHVRMEDDMASALRATRNGAVAATIVIPEDYSRDVDRRMRPRLGLVLDNTDPFVVTTLTAKMSELIEAVSAPEVTPRYAQQVALEVVEVYPYVEYIEYLLPGSIALAIFACAVIGGGLIFIDDKARGLHEGYLVTPISKSQFVFGMLLSGTLKAAFAGMVVTVLGSLLAGVVDRLTPAALALALLFDCVVALALISLVTLLMVRVNDPVVPRATFSLLNTLLFFPSGAMYPVYSFPKWLQAVAAVDPFAYAVHGFRAVLLKDVGIAAIAGDLAFLGVFSAACIGGVLWLFPRRL